MNKIVFIVSVCVILGTLIVAVLAVTTPARVLSFGCEISGVNGAGERNL